MLREEHMKKIQQWLEEYPLASHLKERVPDPIFPYYGDDVWLSGISAVLSGKNLLLVGEKSTGKNVFAENLAKVFQRPLWNVSFHINMDAATLIGTDTLKKQEVVFRKGPVTQAALAGGFIVLDEINMARNEGIAVLHAVLDYRRMIDIPGYQTIFLHPLTRIIATMNYGYEGTRDLNEALLSRFAVIRMPGIDEKSLMHLLEKRYPAMDALLLDQTGKLFFDLRAKAKAGEISTAPVDLRGIMDALDLCCEGLPMKEALAMGIVNKSFDPYERQLIEDVIRARIPEGV